MDFVASGRKVSRERTSSDPDEVPLTPNEQRLYDRLATWRLKAASRDNTAPFIIAHNTMLKMVAGAKPKTLNQLSNLPGFGPVKCEKYGEDILAIVNGDLASD